VYINIIGDWGLGIGDWSIPNPQSPIPKIIIYMRLMELTYKVNYLINKLV